jgi:hypothetical protein
MDFVRFCVRWAQVDKKGTRKSSGEMNHDGVQGSMTEQLSE